ncbi:MAG: hypothetical protein LBJ74_02020 [Heliobacteriaceae bacterium]|nr:hypothetical protein [Heliobacteriaceae bacterium]
MENEIKHDLEDEIKLIAMQIEEIESLSNVILSALLDDYSGVSMKDIANSMSVICDKSEKARNSIKEYLMKI